ncbi:MAG: OmpH family outer membrane protein [Alphaproteobacteria bacterium]|nr:MAG: OmpH family outer membrane protein [Alphaproteobacteria bacterium]
MEKPIPQSKKWVVSVLAVAVMMVGLTVNQLYTSRVEAQVTVPIILVINRAQLLNESEAGKNIATQANTLRETIAKELEDEFQSIKSEEEQLIAQQSLLAPEVLQERAQKLQLRRQKFQVTQQTKNREYQASIAQATGEIGKVLEPILTEMITERSATILIDRAELIFATPEIDVTAEVMKRLNDKLTEVELKRVTTDPNAVNDQQ